MFEQDRDLKWVNSKSAMSRTAALCEVVGKTVLDCDVESASLGLLKEVDASYNSTPSHWAGAAVTVEVFVQSLTLSPTARYSVAVRQS